MLVYFEKEEYATHICIHTRPSQPIETKKHRKEENWFPRYTDQENIKL